MEIKSSMFVNNDENLPQVPPIIYEELKKNFNIDFILGMSDLKSNDEKIGYIRGVRDVLDRVGVLAHIDKE